jgi:steroid 5-alpha reductase family enzyme
MPLFLTIANLILSPLIASFIAGGGDAIRFISAADPLLVVAVWAAGIAAASFLLALVTGDCSQTDRLWSIAPVLYAAFFAWRATALAGGGLDPRACLMAGLVLLWGIRLSFNFARRGGYTRIEDYRWEILRERIPNRLLWELFNLGFIAFFQHAIILAITLPMLVVFQPGLPAMAWPELLLAAAFLASLALETAADQQMWNFQNRKQAALAAGQPAPEGNFIQDGLWRWSRHPNVFFEALNWWLLGFMALAAGGGALLPSLAGAVVLTGLLQGSIGFTESITLAKYPEFAERRRRVSSFLPLPVRKG